MNCIIDVAKTKALISCTVTAQLICSFVFVYVKSRFSHDAAHNIEPRHEKTNVLHMRKQLRRSASRKPRS